MTDILFICRSCHKRLVVESRGMGVTVVCSSCRTPVVVPQPDYLFTCPQCHEEMLTKENLIGIDFDCPSCKTRIRVPEIHGPI